MADPLGLHTFHSSFLGNTYTDAGIGATGLALSGEPPAEAVAAVLGVVALSAEGLDMALYPDNHTLSDSSAEVAKMTTSDMLPPGWDTFVDPFKDQMIDTYVDQLNADSDNYFQGQNQANPIGGT